MKAGHTTTFLALALVGSRFAAFAIGLGLALGCGDDGAAGGDTARDTVGDGAPEATGDSTADTDAIDSDAGGDSGLTIGDSGDATGDDGDAIDDGDDGDDLDDGNGDAVDTTVADTAPPEEVSPSLCSELRPDDCVYEPAASYATTTTRVDGLTYNDVIGETRSFDIAYYLPTDAPSPLPIVLLSHGGTAGQTNPLQTLSTWANTFASTGYLVVAIAHPKRSAASQAALCTALQVQADIPCGVTVNWDEPHDLMRVLDWLEAPPPALAGMLDIGKIAYVGHAEGAGSVLMALGAARNFKCAQPLADPSPNQACVIEDLVQVKDARIDIGIALSPPGPDNSGFLRQSYGGVTRPLLIATGTADGSSAEVANRLAVWPLLPDGGKFKLFLDDEGALSEIFEGEFGICDEFSSSEACDEMSEALFGAGLAFVDAYLKNRLLARQWLASHDVYTGSAGIATWEFK